MLVLLSLAPWLLSGSVTAVHARCLAVFSSRGAFLAAWCSASARRFSLVARWQVSEVPLTRLTYQVGAAVFGSLVVLLLFGRCVSGALGRFGTLGPPYLFLVLGPPRFAELSGWESQLSCCGGCVSLLLVLQCVGCSSLACPTPPFPLRCRPLPSALLSLLLVQGKAAVVC